MTAQALMVQGTASSAGKSILVTALCRILRQDGYSVAPFKAQNMALNSFVTAAGGEIGRSQAVQAFAAGVEPHTDMNPVLLKPQADNCSQLIVNGRVTGTYDARSYYQRNGRLMPAIRKAYCSLASQYDIIVIEGAGSPAEINLIKQETANMRIAAMAGAPVLLVGDIDRGGVFASLAGTMLLLPPRWKKLVSGFVINKFRGDVSLLQPGLDFLEKRYSIPVLGVIPYFRDIHIAQEDSVYLDERSQCKTEGRPDICIIRLPRISNYDDFDPLERSCNVRYIASVAEMGDPDLIILPGTKSTIADLKFLRRSGLAKAVAERAARGTPVIGICGGYQMLGKVIYDPHQAESTAEVSRGLGLLDMDTVFEPSKLTNQVTASVKAGAGLLYKMRNIAVKGYEIHMGRDCRRVSSPAFSIERRGEQPLSEGSVNNRGTVFGTYIHGLFDNQAFTNGLIRNMCRLRGLSGVIHMAIDRENSYDKLADLVRSNLDMQKIYDIIAGGRNGR